MILRISKNSQEYPMISQELQVTLKFQPQNLGIMKVVDIYKHQIGSLMWGIVSASSNKLCTDFKENISHGPKTFRNYGSKLWNWIWDQNFYEPNLSKGLFRKRFKQFLMLDYS